MRQLLIFILAAILTSCGGVSKREILTTLNRNDTIPATYLRIVIHDSEKGFWIGNNHLYNSGGNWNFIDSQSKVGRVHYLTPASLQDIKPNCPIIDQDGKSVYLYSQRLCRGCNECYQKLHDAKLIEYNILKGVVDDRNNLRISTALTPKGEEYRLTSEEANLLQETENIALLKIAEYKFTKVKNISQIDNSITANVEYQLQFTPIGKALGYKDFAPETTEFTFDEGALKKEH